MLVILGTTLVPRQFFRSFHERGRNRGWLSPPGVSPCMLCSHGTKLGPSGMHRLWLRGPKKASPNSNEIPKCPNVLLPANKQPRPSGLGSCSPRQGALKLRYTPENYLDACRSSLRKTQLASVYRRPGPSLHTPRGTACVRYHIVA